MDINQITDKKEIAYMLIQQQRVLAQAQRNCQALEQRLAEVEQTEAAQDTERKATAKEKA